MTRALRRFALVLALIAWAVPAALAAPQQVTLLHVNDTHSHLAPWGPKDANLDGTLGGLAKAAAIVGEARATRPGVIFVHAGDLMNGDPFFNEYLGVPELQLLQAAGLDVMAPGNHEFQFGPQFLASVLDAAWPACVGAVPLVGTNVDISGFPPLGPCMQTTFIKEAGGVKVGFFGLTTTAATLAGPAPVVIDPNLTGVAASAVASLRAEGAQIVVGIAHVGIDVSREIAAATPGIDVIVNGHDHLALLEPEVVDRPDGGTTLIVSAGEYYRWVGRLTLSVDGSQVSLVDYELLSVGPDAPAAPEIDAVVQSLQQGIVLRRGDLYHTQLAVADRPISEEWNPRHAKRDTVLGNLFTDAYRACGQTDIAFEALGFLDEGMPAGPIVGADVFRSMGYGMPAPDPVFGGMTVRPFRLATFGLYGAQILGTLEYSLSDGRDLFPQVSGMHVEFDSSAPAGSRVVAGRTRIGDLAIAPYQVYTVTANEGLVWYLQTLGLELQNLTMLEVSAFDAARTLVQQRGVLGPVVTGRIRDVAR